MSYFGGPLVPLFWISGDVSSDFQSQSGFCLIYIVEVNAMYIPWDPTVVLHVPDLLTVSNVGRRPGSYLAQGFYWHQWLLDLGNIVVWCLLLLAQGSFGDFADCYFSSTQVLRFMLQYKR